MNDVLASGYVIAQIAIMPNDHARTVMYDVTMALTRYRAGFAAHLVDLMPKPGQARLRRRCLLVKDGSSARRCITGFAILVSPLAWLCLWFWQFCMTGWR